MPYTENGNQTYDILRVQDKHREMLRMLAAGFKPQEVADSLGVTVQTVYNLRGTKLGQEMLEFFHLKHDKKYEEIQSRIANMSLVAQMILEDMLTEEISDDTLPMSERRLKKEIALEMLDRAGHGKITKNLTIARNLTKEGLESIKQRARELNEQADGSFE